jgi:hypothetical protein
MEASTPYVKKGWVSLFTLFIFFFNTFALPLGFTFTLLLTPVWFYFIYQQKDVTLFLTLLLPFFLYMLIHLVIGVVIPYYLISFIIIMCMISFLIVAAHYIKDPAYDWDSIFRDIAVLNFILTLISLLFLFIPFLKPLVWYLVPTSKGLENLPRLKLFAPEASHYSFLFAPIAIYFLSRMLFFKTSGKFLMILMIALPLILSFSFSVLGDLLISTIIILFLYSGRIFPSTKRQLLFITVLALCCITLYLASIFYAHNPLFLRIANIFSGDDTSARGRTYESFILANKIVAQKSYWWGIGLGQLKLLGRTIIIHYYTYTNIPDVIRIPNAAAETIIYFGYVGFVLRLLIELLLFVKTKVYKNPFRFWLFLFVFIYQFTGSYITNAAEYLIWIFAFMPVFPEFIKPGKKPA